MIPAHRSNPGGSQDPRFVVGRDRLIAQIWATLEQQSVWMTAERRIGKTHIMVKMGDAPPPHWTTQFFDLEGVATAQEFARLVWKGVESHLGRWKRTTRRAQEVWDVIEGIKAAGAEVKKASGPRTWKDLLTAAVEDLEAEKVELRLLLFFDELTYMIQRIKTNQGEATAMEVLDTLRQLRQTHRSFRMVVSGSIGLHQVLAELRQVGHQNPVLNDLYTIEVPPIDAADARELARSLIAGEKLQASDPGASAGQIAEHGCGWPFFIHHIVKRLAMGTGTAEIGDVDAAVDALLVDAHDPLQMGHFRDRLAWYYPGQQGTAAAILDALALATEPMNVDALLHSVRAAGPQVDRQGLMALTGAMQRDHYLVRDPDGRYRLTLPLFARWWILDRGL